MSFLPKQVVAWGAVVVGALVLSACASVPQNAGFDDVQTLVATRDPALRGLLVWQANPDTALTAHQTSIGTIDTILTRPLTPASTVGLALVRNPSGHLCPAGCGTGGCLERRARP